MPPATLPEYTYEEVLKNNNENEPKSCWIVIDGKVYDVTKFLSEHPGGEESITDLAGQDASEAFHDVGHSADAMEMAEEYLIGLLKGVPPPAAMKSEKSVPTSKINITETLQSIANNSIVKNIVFPASIGLAIYFVYRTVVKSK